MFKYWPQFACSVPASLLLISVVLRHVVGLDLSFNGVEWLIGANVLSFAACVAFSLLSRESKAWRYAALFNAWLLVLALVATIFQFGALTLLHRRPRERQRHLIKSTRPGVVLGDKEMVVYRLWY